MTTTHLPHAVPRSRLRAGWSILAVALALALAAGLIAAAGPRLSVWSKERALPRGQKPAVLLFTLDAVRSDRLGCYGYTAAKTPSLDGLAKQGVVFDQAYVQVPLCHPSHATLMTGRMPARHGARGETDVLGLQVPTLAEQFRAAGYRTAAFVSTSSLDQALGLGRGFEVYQDDFGPAGKRPGAYERAFAPAVADRVLAWLEVADTRPLFLWVHLADAMAPHNATEATAREFPGQPYDAEVSAVDAQVGRLAAAMRRKFPKTLVVATADHGESLGDHGETTFGFFLYSATTRVPLLLSMPGHLPAGVRVAPVVRSMDVAPTLLDLVGLPAPAEQDGVSLVPLLIGRSREGPGPAAMENLSLRAKYGLAPLFALRKGPYLFVKARRPELYDTVQDPGEKDDASSRLTRQVPALDSELRTLVADSGANETLTDPKDALDLYGRYHLALEMEGRRDFERAAAAQRSILSEAPAFTSARRRLSELLLRLGRFGESDLVLKELIEKDAALDSTYLNLALIRYRAKKTDEALEWLSKGVAAFPSSAGLRHRHGRLLLEATRYAEAEEQLRRAQALEPRFLDVYVALGAALTGLGRKDEARTVYEKVREIAPDSPEAGEAAVALGLAPASPAPASAPPILAPASPPPATPESPLPFGSPPP